jgi:pSer/pThr/pTyr-binding forkhead associated (FHA) protein
MSTIYKLILQSGVGAGTEYPLDKTDLLLGRDLSNDIVVNDPEVSRRHARLILQEGSYILEDLSSTNGTFIRGQRLGAPMVLRPGETITIGEKVVLKYEVIQTDPNATVVVQRRVVDTTQPPAAPAPIPAPRPVAAAVPMPPVQPVSIQPPVVQQPPARKKKSKALIIILVLLAILFVFCLIPWLIIEMTDSYCALFPGVFNALQAGACP